MNWGTTFSIVIDGTNRTADVTGGGFVEHELDSAAIAEFNLVGAMPAVGDTVVISGIVAIPFTGIVDTVQYDPDPAHRYWVVTCTDNLQGYFEELGNQALAAGREVWEDVVDGLPVGAYWHEALFSSATDGWEVAQDAMSVIPASIWLEEGELQSVPWDNAVPGTSIEHGDGALYDGSVTLQTLSSRDMVKEVVAVVELRYTRLHQWKLSVAWAGPRSLINPTEAWTFCENYNNPITWPTREMIAETVTTNSWSLLGHGGLLSGVGGDGLGINTTGLWPSGTYDTPVVDCGPVIWDLGEEGDQYVMSASWTCGRRWAQTISEKYTITITGTAAVGNVENESIGYEFTGDDGSWDSSTPAMPLPTQPEPNEGWITTYPQHSYLDQYDAAERDEILAAIISLVATRIRATQRVSTLTAKILPGTEPRLGDRITLVAADVSGEGLVQQLRSSWDFDSHAASCELTLNLSSGDTGDDDFTLPTPPDVTPDDAGYSLDSGISLETHIGSVEDCPEQDDEWNGWVGNRQVPMPADEDAPVYNSGFTNDTPDVPDEARDEQVGEVTASYSIAPLTGSLTFL